MYTAAIAAARFGLGARPGDLAMLRHDPEKWLLTQIAGPSRTPAAIRELPDSASVLVAMQDLRRRERAQGRDTPDFAKTYGRKLRELYVEQANARYLSAVSSTTPFHERLVHFWSNHFAVSADKQPLPAIAGLYENEAIRPHVNGKFIDLLLAAEKHPALLTYLDNARSVGPGSSLAKRASRRRQDRSFGLNENLAREILELHTLGVNGGYTQQDVTSFARVITGWSVGGTSDSGRFADGTPGKFEFREIIHEPGAQIVLGKRYRQQDQRQGEAVLADLAVHPATARHIASKLARHFVADYPPATLVERLTATYLDSDGDLPAVYTALIRAKESWQKTHSKYKTPHDFVISTLRAFDYRPDNRRSISASLDLMGQTTWRPGSPAGWPDTAEQWGGADALYKRIEWANAVAQRVASRVNPVSLGSEILGAAFSAETRKAISRAESLVQGTTLLLASPDFQRK